jgi:hypothetical protein
MYSTTCYNRFCMFIYVCLFVYICFYASSSAFGLYGLWPTWAKPIWAKPIWALAHMGAYGPRPIWGRGHKGPGPVPRYGENIVFQKRVLGNLACPISLEADLAISQANLQLTWAWVGSYMGTHGHHSSQLAQVSFKSAPRQPRIGLTYARSNSSQPAWGLT